MLTHLICLAAIGNAVDNTHYHKFFSHNLCAKSFYRMHFEEGYKYKTWGMGLEYKLIREKGLNLRIGYWTNPIHKTRLIENEIEIGYKLPLNNPWTWFPILSTRITHHQIKKQNNQLFIINKHVLYLGIGLEYTLNNNFIIFGQIQSFKDIHNSILIKENDNFWGTSYTNPYGYQAKIGVSSLLLPTSSLNFINYFSHTFLKCYKEYGCELNYNWRF